MHIHELPKLQSVQFNDYNCMPPEATPNAILSRYIREILSTAQTLPRQMWYERSFSVNCCSLFRIFSFRFWNVPHFQHGTSVLLSSTAEPCFRWRLQSKMLTTVVGWGTTVSANIYFFESVLWVARDKYIFKPN